MNIKELRDKVDQILTDTYQGGYAEADEEIFKAFKDALTELIQNLDHGIVWSMGTKRNDLLEKEKVIKSIHKALNM